jgi:vacuolar protein sorting-associated protein 13A/C
VHIRYEDKYSLPSKHISFGLYLKEFRAETVDVNGKANFLNADEKIVYKLGVLKGFNVYWNCEATHAGFLTTKAKFSPIVNATWVDHLRDSIETRRFFATEFESFIRNNLDLENRLTLRRSHQKNESHLPPKIIFQSSVNAIDFVFQRVQYKTILQIVDYYSLLNVHKKYVKYRPKEFADSVAAKRYRSWWRYTFTALAETTWRSYRKDRMLAQWRAYKSYLSKYERKLIVTKVQQKEVEARDLIELELLEKHLTLESILDLRSLCHERVRLKYNKFDAEEKADQIAKPDDDLPRNYVKFRFLLNFPFISFKLKNADLEILRIDFTEIVSKFELRPVTNSIYFLLNTRGIDIYGIHYANSDDKKTQQSRAHSQVKLVASRKRAPEPSSRSAVHSSSVRGRARLPLHIRL